jgi:hypothetical protein
MLPFLEAQWAESRGMTTPAPGRTIIARQTANRSPSLRGTLADLGIGEVLTLLSSSSATGRLIVTAADRPRHLDLREGEVVGASGSIGRPLEPGKVREGIAEVMLDLVMLEDAPFEFGPHEEVPEGGESFPIRTVLDDVNQRVDDWRKIAAVIPSTSVVAKLADKLPEASDEVKLDRDSWRVVAALDGRRTVGDVMLLTGMGAFEACGILHRLATAGAVEVTG